jgi:hypothetical protein
MNNTTGVASTAGKFSSAFALGSELFFNVDRDYANNLRYNAQTAFKLGLDKPGVAQTASVLSPYIYAEDNWTDDMELASAATCEEENYFYKRIKHEESRISHIQNLMKFILMVLISMH